MGALISGLLLTGVLGSVAHAAEPPTVTDFSVSGSPSASGELAFNLSFSAEVTGLEQADLALVEPVLAGCAIGDPVVAPSPANTFTIAVTGCTADGAVQLRLAANSVALVEEESTTGPASETLSAIGTIDRTPPAVTSFTVNTPTPVTGTQIEYSLVFSEPVTGLTTTSFTVSHATSAGWSVSGLSGADTSYVVTLTRASPPSQTGSVTLTLKKDAVTDAAANLGPVSAQAAPAVAVAPPSIQSATLGINDGAASTTDPTLKLTLATSGLGSNQQMRFSIDAEKTWTAWQAFAASRDLALPAKHRWGTVTVVAEVKDGANKTAKAQAAIQYGQAPRSTMALKADYLIKAALNYSNGRITAQQTVDLVNSSKQVIGWLDFSVFPRQYDKLTVSVVTVDGLGASPIYTNKANMRVPLGFNLRPGEAARAVIHFVATANANTSNYQRSRLAKADGVMQVSSWHPLLSDGHGVRLPGDGQFSAAGNYRLELTHPSGVVIAAPGKLVSSTSTTKVYTLPNAREYAFAASPQFASTSARTAHGVQVVVYYVAGTKGAANARNAAVRALERHQQLGAYPYDRLVIAHGTRTSVALEYSGMILMGRSVLGNSLIVAHEVAHQWWYGIVGNDQLNDPWIDEGFSEFTSRWLSGTAMPKFCSSRPVSASIYDFPTSMTYGCDSYGETVYHKAAVFLNGIRLRLGDTPFRNALRAIVAENRYGIATTAEVREVFVRHSSNKAALNAYMDTYLKTGVGSSDPALSPQVNPPSRALFADQPLGSSVKLRLSWSAAASGTTITRYELQRRKGTNRWVSIGLASPTATGAEAAVQPGAGYRFRLRAVDASGVVGPWATTGAATVSLAQETAGSVAWTGAWTRAALSGASGGYVRHSSASGRVARLSFTGSSVALVSTRAANRGIAEIWLNGAKVDTIDLYAASAQKARVVWAAPVAAGKHTLEVRVTGSKRTASSGTRVDVDAFLVHP